MNGFDGEGDLEPCCFCAAKDGDEGLVNPRLSPRGRFNDWSRNAGGACPCSLGYRFSLLSGGDTLFGLLACCSTSFVVFAVLGAGRLSVGRLSGFRLLSPMLVRSMSSSTFTLSKCDSFSVDTDSSPSDELSDNDPESELLEDLE